MSGLDPRWCSLIRPATIPPAPAPRKRIADRADYDPDYDPSKPIACECCGSTMYYTAACKIQCRNCGYQRDCSDP